jgi:flagellar biosynthesis protein FliQ
VRNYLRSRTQIPKERYYENIIVKSIFMVQASKIFNIACYLMIIINSIIQSLTDLFSNPTLQIISSILFFLFVVELSLRFIGSGMLNFIRDPLKLLDFVILVTCVVDMRITG